MKTIIAVPYHLGEENVGAGKGPIRYIERLAPLNKKVIKIRQNAYSRVDAIMRVNRAVASAVRRDISHGSIPIVLGGDCMVSLGVVAGIGAECYVFWFDAHGDFNTPRTSETGYLDGMPLAILAGRWYRDLLVNKRPVRESNIFLIGARALDPREMEALNSSEVRTPGELPKVKTGMEAYLHIDLDVLDPSIAPGVDFKALDGLFLEDVEQVIKSVAGITNIKAVTLTSYNPVLDVEDKTLNA